MVGRGLDGGGRCGRLGDPQGRNGPDQTEGDGGYPARRRRGSPVRRRPGVRPARRRQDGDRLDGVAERPRRALDGLHAGRRPRVHRHRRGPVADPALHLGAQHRRHRHRRHRRPRARRHRPRRRDAGDGGQGRPVQAVRRRRRRTDLPGHHRRRGDHRDRRPARAELRRDQPRGHLRAPLLRDRGAAQGAALDPGVPRRPARHRRGRARRPEERAQADRPRPRLDPRGDLRRRCGRRRRREDPARGGRPRPRGARPQGRPQLAALGPHAWSRRPWPS